MFIGMQLGLSDLRIMIQTLVAEEQAIPLGFYKFSPKRPQL